MNQIMLPETVDNLGPFRVWVQSDERGMMTVKGKTIADCVRNWNELRDREIYLSSELMKDPTIVQDHRPFKKVGTISYNGLHVYLA